MGLMNWPPSRGGENPFEPLRREYLEGEIARSERLLEQMPTASQALEIDILNFVQSGGVPEGQFPLRETVVPTEQLNGSFYCNYHVSTVATLTLAQAHDLLFVYQEGAPPERWESYRSPATIEVEINYPLSLALFLTISPARLRSEWNDGRTTEQIIMSPGYVLLVLAREYRRIYSEHGKYGVWGHALDDLFFEGLIVDGSSVTLLMGS